MPTQMPRNGRPLPRTVSSSASTMPGTASSPRRQSAKAPTPGSTTRSARAHHVGIARHHDRLIVPGLARRALERLGGRVQIARAVVDDRDAHGSRMMRAGSGARLRLRKQADDVVVGGRHVRRRLRRRRRGRTCRRLTDPAIEEAPLGGLAIVRDHDAAIEPAARSDQRRSEPASKPTSSAISRLTVNFTSADDAERPQRRLKRADADHVHHEHQPQPVPQQPERRRAGTPRNRSRRARRRSAPAARPSSLLRGSGS